MRRNRGNFDKFNKSGSLRLSEGNTLTKEQRRLVEKQQEMIRNLSRERNTTSLPPQTLKMVSSFTPLSILPSIGGVMPVPELMSNLLSVGDVIASSSFVSVPSMVPPPPLIPAPATLPPPTVQIPPLMSGGLLGNSLYGQDESHLFSPKNLGGAQQSHGFRKFDVKQRDDGRRWYGGKKKQPGRLQVSDEKRSPYSRMKQAQNWTRKQFSSDQGENCSMNKLNNALYSRDQTSLIAQVNLSNQADVSAKDKLENSFFNHRDVNDSNFFREKQREELNYAENRQQEICAQRSLFGDSLASTHLRQTADVGWAEKGPTLEERNKSVESENFWNSSSKDREERPCGEYSLQGNDVVSYETELYGKSWFTKNNDTVENPQLKKYQIDNSSESNNYGGANEQVDSETNNNGTTIADKENELRMWRGHARKDEKPCWQPRNKDDKELLNIASPLTNFLYPDPSRKPTKNVWTRLDSTEEPTDDSRVRTESDLAFRMGFINSRLGQMDNRILQINALASNIPSGETSRPEVWEKPSGLLSLTDLNTQPAGHNSDLRQLLHNKTTATIQSKNDESDLGGWSENMVLIYPFFKNSHLSQADIYDLRSQLSRRVHMLLQENIEDIQPKFLDTRKVCKNWFMIHCADGQTVNWVLDWKPQLTTKKRMNICIRRALDAVKITHISIFLRGIKDNIRNIELRLNTQNQHLEPKLWRRGPHYISSTGVTVSYLVDAACLRLISAHSWYIYYELTKFSVTVEEYKPIVALTNAK